MRGGDQFVIVRIHRRKPIRLRGARRVFGHRQNDVVAHARTRIEDGVAQRAGGAHHLRIRHRAYIRVCGDMDKRRLIDSGGRSQRCADYHDGSIALRQRTGGNRRSVLALEIKTDRQNDIFPLPERFGLRHMDAYLSAAAHYSTTRGDIGDSVGKSARKAPYLEYLVSAVKGITTLLSDF